MATQSKNQNKNTQIVQVSPQQFLNDNVKNIAKYCEGTSNAQSIVNSALMAFNENWRLQEAMKTDVGRSSVYHAMLRAASVGLSLNPLEGKCALIPYSVKSGNDWVATVSYQIMKNGLLELAVDNPQVDNISTGCVRDKDQFRLVKTSDGDKYEHSPARKEAGLIDGAYASITLKNGKSHVEYMAIEQLEEHGRSYSAAYRKDIEKETFSSPWTTSKEGMYIKTALKKALRNFHISDVIKRAVSADDQQEREQFVKASTSGAGEISQQLKQKEAAKKQNDEKIVDAEIKMKNEGAKKNGVSF